MTQGQFEAAFAQLLGDYGISVVDGNDRVKPVSKSDARNILEILGEQIQTTLEDTLPSITKMQRGEKPPSLNVRGVGRFAVRFRKARPKRMGRNPATGEDVEIAAKPASRKLVITPDKNLKYIVE